MYGALLDKEKLKYCYQCGKCSSGCDVNRLDNSFQPHRLIYLVGRGEIDEVLINHGLWKCTTCFTCSERCPQGIKVTEILWIVRSMIAASGHMPESLVMQREVVLKTGRLIPLDNKKREKSGLLPLTEGDPLVARIVNMTMGEREIK